MINKYKPDNMPDLLPYLVVMDMEASIDFYQKALGFEIENIKRDDSGTPLHVEMRRGWAVVMFGPEGMYELKNKSPKSLGITAPLALYVYCHDVDKVHNMAVANGAESIDAPQDAFWGDRFCKVIDINGYEWVFARTLLHDS